MEVAELQKRLVEALCGLRNRAAVDLDWVQGIWGELPADWVGDFWHKDKGVRAEWCKLIAATSKAIKREILNLMKEQLRFAELYSDSTSFRVTVQSWRVRKNSRTVQGKRESVMEAVSGLLGSFYDPLFYESSGYGYPNDNGSRFHKDQFLGKPKICPYSDNKIQDAKLDHFLPKETFPFLSCHPDNLIPCSTDPNSVARKGRRIPLQHKEPDQANEWFHPRFRPAIDKYSLGFDERSSTGPRVQFVAVSQEDQPRLDRMAKMFGLIDFWSRDLQEELQFLAGETRDRLARTLLPINEAAIREYLEERKMQARGRIGHDALAIVTAAFYEHILNTPTRFAQVVRTCLNGT